MTAKDDFRAGDTSLRKVQHERNAVKTSRYTVEKCGILNAKPRVDYNRVIRQFTIDAALYGVELEIERKPNDTFLDYALRLLGKGYVCDDGSLRDSGAELVIQPASERDIKGRYGEIKQALQILSKAGARSHDVTTCGLHVHVSRKALKELQWEKLHRFLYQSRTFFKKLSRRVGRDSRGRDCFYFCAFNDSYRDARTNRYSALNACNTDTIEFRFFRGTLNPISYLASLECIFSLVNYQKWLGDNAPTLRGYKAYIRSGKYPYITKYVGKLFPPVQRRSVSAEERAARAEARAAARQLKQERWQRRAEAIKLQCERTLTENQRVYMPSSRYSLAQIEGATIRKQSVPIRLIGRWSREDQKIMETYPKTIEIYSPLSIPPEWSIRFNRRYGYGRESFWTHVG